MTDRGVAGLLLTGGASRRFGADKATVLVGGVPLAERLAAALVAATDPALEVGPGVTGLPTVVEQPAGEGPLAAVAAGWHELERLGHDGDAVVTAVDLPLVTAALVRWLAGHPATTSVVPTVDGRAQPLFARYTADAMREAVRLVGKGERAMGALLDTVDVTTVGPRDWAAVAPADALTDVDSAGDLERLRAAGRA